MKRNNLFIISLIFSVTACTSQAKLIEATKEDALKRGTVLAKFSATWCGACKNSKAPFNALSESYPNVTFADIDIDKARDWSGKYKIESLPTFVLLENGNEVARAVGYSEEKIKSMLSSAKPSKKAEAMGEVKPAAPENKPAPKATTAPAKTQYSSF